MQDFNALWLLVIHCMCCAVCKLTSLIHSSIIIFYLLYLDKFAFGDSIWSAYRRCYVDDELFAQQGRIESLLAELGAWSCQGQC